MKKALLFLTVLLVFVYACSDDNTFYNEDNANDFDIKAYKMEQIGSLFESIARQPELADEMIKSTEQLLYSNINDILPISDAFVEQRGTARGTAFSSLFDAIARQPECRYKLDSTAEQFLGSYDNSIISDEMLEFQKTFAYTGLIEAIARQPEFETYMDTICYKYLGCALEELIK